MTRVGQALAELRAAAVRNLHAQPPAPVEFDLKGATHNDQAVRLSMAGQLPDGRPVREDAAFFTRGARVFQATVLGAHASAEALATFFDGLRFAL